MTYRPICAGPAEGLVRPLTEPKPLAPLNRSLVVTTVLAALIMVAMFWLGAATRVTMNGSRDRLWCAICSPGRLIWCRARRPASAASCHRPGQLSSIL